MTAKPTTSRAPQQLAQAVASFSVKQPIWTSLSLHKHHRTLLSARTAHAHVEERRARLLPKVALTICACAALARGSAEQSALGAD